MGKSHCGTQDEKQEFTAALTAEKNTVYQKH